VFRASSNRWRWPHALVAAYALWCWLDALWLDAPYGYDLAAGIVVAGALAWATFAMRLQGMAPAICRVRGDTRQIFLTFDDGPDPATTPAVLGILARHDAHATFFLLGEKVEAHPELTRELCARGHTVAIHGYRHSWKSFLTPRRAKDSIVRAREVVRAATGRAPIFFRPPYGVVTPATAIALAVTGMRLVGWTIRSWDTVGWNSPDAILARVVERLSPGAIVLLHDAPERAGARAPCGPAILERLLTAIVESGLDAVGLDEAALLEL